MTYIFYFLLWLAFESIVKADRNRYIGLNARVSGYTRNMSARIVGGVEVPISMYPHVATLVIENYIICGGSIMSDRVILTAGHCVVNTALSTTYDTDQFVVYLGSGTLMRGVHYKVCKVIPHEKYLHSKKHYFYDIAVLILETRIKFGPLIQTIEIAKDGSWRNENFSFTIAGFGLPDVLASSPSSKLLATRMFYVNSNTCNQSQSAITMIVPNHMFCMIGQRWTSDCYGDSGSGVIWKRQIVGLVSVGRVSFCGGDMTPSMYTDVTYFKDWIQSKIKEAQSITNCWSSKKKWSKNVKL